jgi:tetratricopeptide (TPR) repeat protein
LCHDRGGKTTLELWYDLPVPDPDAVSAVLYLAVPLWVFYPRESWSESARRFWATVVLALRILKSHLVQVLASALTLSFAVLLARSYLDHFEDQAYGLSRDDLVLVGVVVGLAILAQSGHDLLLRLKKVGPVEFIERRSGQIIPELEGLGPTYDVMRGDPKRLSKTLVWQYEKTETYLTHLEWSGLGASGLSRNRKLHELIFRMTSVAMIRGHWERVIDRLELLLDISEGQFKAAEAHYRCGSSCLRLAEEMTPADGQQEDRAKKEEREHLLQKAQDHLSKATKEDPHLYRGFFILASVQFHLQAYPLAVESNDMAIRLFDAYAAAKVNLAICHVKRGQLGQAWKALESIKKSDEHARERCRGALAEKDLSPLFEDPELGPMARQHLGQLIA